MDLAIVCGFTLILFLQVNLIEHAWIHSNG
jgi:hypothetical protein